MTWQPQGEPLDVDEEAQDEPEPDERTVQATWRLFSSWVEHDPWYIRLPLVAWFYLVVAYSYVAGWIRALR